MSSMKSDVKLFFLGKREYVQAPIQLKLALKGIQKQQELGDLSDIFVHRYKQVHEVNSPLEILPVSEVEPEDSLRATLEVTIGDRSLDYKLIAVHGAIERHPDISYCQVNYREQSDIEARSHLPEVEDFWEVLNEAVQLTKVFHIAKYNRDRHYRFVVGGFEQLRYMAPRKSESLEIACRIVRHILREDTIYNYTRITVESDSNKYSFFMPFIGKELGI